MQTHRLRWVSVLLALAFAMGCGGGSHSSNIGGSTSIGSTDRATALAAASQKWDSISHADPGAATTQMADWLKTQKAFVDSGVTNDLFVWATLQDGSTVGWTDDSYLNGSNRSASSAPLSSTPTRDLPSGKTAYLFHSDLFSLDASRAGSDIRPQLAAILQKAGYDVVRSNGTLADFQAINAANDGLLWTNSHGTILPVKVGGATQTHYFMASSTTVNTSDDKQGSARWDDLHNGRLIYLKNPGQPYFYWFAGAWLQQNVHFGQNSIWINNACESTTTQEMSDAAFHNGLSAYTGWDESVLWTVANNSALYLVDRMAGANLTSPTPEPPQRPFNLDLVFADLKQNTGLAVSAVDIPWFFKYLPPPFNAAHGVTAHLQVLHNPFAGASASPVSDLAPSIDSLVIANNQTQVQVIGAFGSKPGKVTIGGQDVALQAGWDSARLVCTLPPGDQAGGSGDVVVEVDGRKSNPVPLTMWSITIHAVDTATYSGTIVVSPADAFSRELDADVSGSTIISGDMVVWIRVDIHDSRIQPGSTPQSPSLREYTLVSSIVPTQNVKLIRWNASGTSTEDFHAPGAEISQHNTTTLAPVGSPPVLFDGSDPRAQLAAANITIDPQAHTMTLYVGPYGKSLFEATVKSDVTGTSQQDGGGIDFHLDNTSNGPNPFNIHLDDNFNVQSGSQSETYSQPTQGVSGTRTFSWSGQVSSLPTADAARTVKTNRTKSSWHSYGNMRQSPASRNTSPRARIR